MNIDATWTQNGMLPFSKITEERRIPGDNRGRQFAAHDRSRT